jgi:signal transduction histidine kinase
MSFRTMLGVVIAVAVGIFVIIILASTELMRGQIYNSFNPTLAVQVDAVLQNLLMQHILVLFVVSIVVSSVTFWIISALVAKPLKLLAKVMNEYVQTETRVEVPLLENAPSEIRSLAVSFDSFMSHTEESHKHDTEVSRVKSDFISTAAHQFRTPLTGIRWALEALQKEQLTENQKALVASAVDKSHDLVGIVGTLLDISAIESGKYQYKFQPTNMREMVERLMSDFTPLASQKKVSLFYSHEEGQEYPPARADSERIKWVLNNLIENAIQYTPENGTVRVSIETAERRIFIRVKDSGIGILPEDRSNIFERFYRAKNAISKEQKGNGLGLYIARTIATDHGGDLSFIPNTEGIGTTFVLSLPVA